MTELYSILLSYLRNPSDAKQHSQLKAATQRLVSAPKPAQTPGKFASLSAAVEWIAEQLASETTRSEVLRVCQAVAQRLPREGYELEFVRLWGLLLWKLANDAKLAEPYFRRLLRMRPHDEDLLNFYRERYQGPSGASSLLQILGQAKRAASEDRQLRQALAHEMAELAEHELKSYDRAIEIWRSVIREEGFMPEAVETLQRLYRQTGKWTALIELLTKQQEDWQDDSSKQAERVELLWQIAGIYQQQMNLAEMALATCEKIFALTPQHIPSLQVLSHFYRENERWDELTKVLHHLQLAAEKSADPAAKQAFAAEIGNIDISKLDDPKTIIAPLLAAYQAAPENTAFREALVRIYTKAKQWPELLQLYRKELATHAKTSSLEQLQQIRIAIAQLLEKMHAESGQIIAAWSDVIAFHGPIEEAFTALLKICQQAKQWEQVEHLLKQRIEHSQEASMRAELWWQLGQLYAGQLQAPDAALHAWKQVLREQPGHEQAMQALAKTLGAEQRWDELIHMYEEQGRIAKVIPLLQTAGDTYEDPDERIELYQRIAWICRERLGQPKKAQQVLEKILGLKADQRAVAQELAGIYREQGDWLKLMSCNEYLLRANEDEDERLRILQEMIELAGYRLLVPMQAFIWASKAYQLRPRDAALRAQVIAAAEKCAGWDELIELFEERLAQDDCDSQESLDLLTKMAEICRDRLADGKAAQVYFRRILEFEPNHDATLHTLETLYTGSQRWQELSEVYRKRLEAIGEPQLRMNTLRKLANLYENRLDNVQEAIYMYSQILELAAEDRDALASLTRLYRRSQQWSALLAILDLRIHVATSRSERVELLFERAKICADEMQIFEQAIDNFLEVLQLDPEHLPTLDALEHLRRSVPASASRIMRGLLPHYRGTRNLAGEALALQTMVLDENDAEAKREYLIRLRSLYEQLGGHEEQLLTVMLQHLELKLLAEKDRQNLRRQAKHLNRSSALADIYRLVLQQQGDFPERNTWLFELGQILVDDVHDIDAARQWYAHILDHEDFNPSAMKQVVTSLKHLHEKAGDFYGLADALSKELNFIEEEQKRIKIGLELGTIQEQKLADFPQATASYQQVLDLDPSNDQAFAALARIFTKQGDEEQLCDLLHQRIMVVEDEQEKINLWQKIGELQQERDPHGAIEAFQWVLDLHPSDGQQHQRALASLIAINRKLARWGDVEEGLARLAEIAESQTARRQAQVERAEVIGVILHRYQEAIDLLQEVLQSDPAFASARSVLLRLLDVSPYKAQIVAILVKIYEQEDNWQALLALDQRQASHLEQGSEKTKALLRIADTYQHRLHDDKKAIELLGEALQASLGSAEFAEVLTRLEAQKPTLEQARIIIQNYQKIANEINDLSLRLRVLRSLGSLALHTLEDMQAARNAYEQGLELAPDELRFMDTLAVIYASQEEHQALVKLWLQRANYTENIQHRDDLLIRAAEMSVKQLHEPGQALQLYEQLSEDGRARPAVAASLEVLYELTEEYESLCQLLIQKLQHIHGPGRIDTLMRLEHLYRCFLDRMHEGLDLLLEVIRLEPAKAFKSPAFAAYLEDETTHLRAYEEFEPVLNKLHDGPHLLELYQSHLAYTEDNEQLSDVYQKIATLQEGQLHQPEQALTSFLQAMKHTPGNPALRQQAYRLATQQKQVLEYAQALSEALSQDEIGGDDGNLNKALAEVAHLWVNELKDIKSAIPLYRKKWLLATETKDSFKEYEQVLQQAKMWSELAEAYTQEIDRSGQENYQIELFLRLAKLASHTLQDIDTAIWAYQQILQIDPKQATAAKELHQLFKNSEQWSALLDLLQQQMDNTEDHAQRVQNLLHMAEIEIHHLAAMEDACTHLEYVFEYEAANTQAITQAITLLRSIAEKYPEFRQRIAEMLTPVYERLHDMKGLILCAEWQLSVAEDAGERLALFQQIAKLLEQQNEAGKGLQAAFHKLLQALPIPDIESGGEQLDQELKERALALQAEDVLSEALLAAASTDSLQHDTARRIELLTHAAQLQQHLGQHELAKESLAQALELDADNLAVLRQLDELYTELSEDSQLRAVLERRCELEPEVEDQLAVLRRLALKCEEVWHDTDGAIFAWNKLLQWAAEDRQALTHLLHLYQAKDDSEKLIDILERQIEVSQNVQERSHLRHQLAQFYRAHTHDRHGEISVYRALLSEQPKDQVAMVALYQALLAEEQFNDAALVLFDRLEMTEHEQERIELLLQLAQLYQGPLQDPVAAVSYYEQILGIQRDHTQALHELLKMAQAGTCLELITTLLEPILRDQQLYAQLDQLLEIHVATAEDIYDRFHIFKQRVENYRLHMQDPSAACTLLMTAFASSAEQAVIQFDLEEQYSWFFEQLKSLSSELGTAEQVIPVLLEHAADETFAMETRITFVKMGAEIAETILDDKKRALFVVMPMIEAQMGNEDLCLYGERLARAVAAKRQLLLCLRELARLCKQGECKSPSADIFVRLGDVETDLGEYVPAVEAYCEALIWSPGVAGAVAGLERLLETDLVREQPVDFKIKIYDELEQSYQASQNVPGLIRLLRFRLVDANSSEEAIAILEQISELAHDQERVATFLQIAQIYEQQGEYQRYAEMLKRARDCDPQGLEGAQVYLRIAKMYTDSGKKQRWLLKAFECQPGEQKVADSLIKVWSGQGEWTKIAELLPRTLQDDFSEAKKIWYLHHIDQLLKNQAFTLALRALEPLAQKNQNDVDVDQRLADAYYGCNRLEKAK